MVAAVCRFKRRFCRCPINKGCVLMKSSSKNHCRPNSSVSTRSNSKWNAVGNRWLLNESVSARNEKPSVFSLRHADSTQSSLFLFDSITRRLSHLCWVWLDFTQRQRLGHAGRWGIAVMVCAAVNTFNRCQHTLAHLSPTPTQPVETHSENGRGGLLKILVSVVRFHPGPP